MIYASFSLLALWFSLKCVCSYHTSWVIQHLCYQQRRFWHFLPVKCLGRKRKTGKKQNISSVQSFSCVQLFATPRTAEHQASLSITKSWSLLKLMSIVSVMPSHHLILWQSLLLLPSIFPSIRVFSSKSAFHIKCPKYSSFSFSSCPSNEYSGLISFRIDWLDILAVQGTLRSLLQLHSLKASIF